MRAKPTYLTAWRALQGSTLLMNIAILCEFARALGGKGRMDWTDWRAEEWTNLGVTAGDGMIRMAFLLCVGVGAEGRRKGEGEQGLRECMGKFLDIRAG